MLFSILRAIILDAFALMRTRKSEVDSTLANRCFVCHQHREAFEEIKEQRLDFKHHTLTEHNVCSYQYFAPQLYRPELYRFSP